MGWSPGLKSIQPGTTFEAPIGFIKKTIANKKDKHQTPKVARATVVKNETAQSQDCFPGPICTQFLMSLRFLRTANYTNKTFESPLYSV